MKAMLLLFILCTPLCKAQEFFHISGTVLAENKPVAFANVLVKNTSAGTQTNENGRFSLRLKSPNPTLEISALGYETISKEVTIKNSDSLELHIILKESILELDAVMLIDRQSGLTRRTPYALSAVQMQSVSQNSNPGGISGVLKELPGISGAEMGTGIVKPFIRGLGFSRVVTIYQHNKLENHQWGQDHGLGLSTLGVKNADVIKGPASILYGSGAIGGVIIIKDNEDYLYSDAPVGRFGTSFNSVSLGTRTFASVGNKFTNGLFFAADASYENHADYKDGNNRIIGNSRFNNHTFRAHTGFKGDSFKNKISFTYHRQNLGIIDDNEMEETLATTRSDRQMQLPFQEVTDYLVSYSQETNNENLETFLHLSHHLNDRSEIESGLDKVDLGLEQNHTFYSGRATLFPKRDFTHTFGIQGSFITTSNKPESEEILIPDATVSDIGFYYLGSKQFEKFFLQGGLRYDYRETTASASAQHLIDFGFILPGNPDSRELSTYFRGFTGSLGASYSLTERQQLKLNFSSGFRAPDLAELFSNGNHPGTSRFEKGNVNFEREQSWQTDLSYSLASSTVDIGISFYLNDISNYIFFTNTGEVRPEDGLEIWEFQQKNALLYGTEGEITYRPLNNKTLTLKATAAIVRGKLKETEENLTFIPADNFSFETAYEPLFFPETRFTATVIHAVKQDRPGFNELSTPGYTVFNSGLFHDFKLKKGVLSTGISGQNIFNRNYVQHLSILRAFAIPNPGRNIQVTVGYTF